MILNKAIFVFKNREFYLPRKFKPIDGCQVVFLNCRTDGHTAVKQQQCQVTLETEEQSKFTSHDLKYSVTPEENKYICFTNLNAI